MYRMTLNTFAQINKIIIVSIWFLNRKDTSYPRTIHSTRLMHHKNDSQPILLLQAEPHRRWPSPLMVMVLGLRSKARRWSSSTWWPTRTTATTRPRACSARPPPASTPSPPAWWPPRQARQCGLTSWATLGTTWCFMAPTPARAATPPPSGCRQGAGCGWTRVTLQTVSSGAPHSQGCWSPLTFEERTIWIWPWPEPQRQGAGCGWGRVTL